ncbi:MAG: ParA family protein [Chloroflexi bacterium]|nr:ParA family protein [Chloroflexota bacterium]
MGTIIALANQKGGVGKTTTAINLGAALARNGRRVLIFDFDPQANSTAGLGMRTQGLTTYDVVVGGTHANDVVVETTIENLSLIPATPSLAGAEVELVPMMAREFRLRRALEPLRDRYDYILIDCPPSLGLLTVNALAAADEVIVPVQCEYLALEGLGQLTSTLELVRRNLNPHLSLRGLLLTMFDGRTNLSQQVADEVRAHFAQTFKTVIPRSVRLSEAPSHGQSIFQYDPSSRASAAYDALAQEVIAGDNKRETGPGQKEVAR